MKKFFLLTYLLILSSGTCYTMAELKIEWPIFFKSNSTLQEEGEALHKQGARLNPDGYQVKDSAALKKSIKCLQTYTRRDRKAGNRYWMMLAENYYALGMIPEASSVYQAHKNDGLAQLRLGEILNQPDTTTDAIRQAMNYYVNGLSMRSSNKAAFKQASQLASEALPLCFFQLGDDENAKRYHRAYAHDSEAEANMWLYQLYWDNNQYDHAIQCVKEAAKVDPTNQELYERIAGYYFNLQQYEQALPYWQHATEIGSMLGHVRLGQAYHEAQGCPKNDSLAIAHFEQGLPTLHWVWAEKMLASIYMQGDATTNPNYNLTQGHYWLQQASDHGDWNAKTTLAKSLAYWGRQSSDSLQRSQMLHQANLLAIELAARQPKDSVAWMILATFWGDSILSQPHINVRSLQQQRTYLAINYERDRKICQLLADSGCIDAIVELGRAHFKGQYTYNDYLRSHTIPIDTNYTLGLSYWQRGLTIDPHNDDCITAITEAYTYGWGVRKDVSQAKQFWEAHGKFSYASSYFYPWRTYRMQRGDIDEIVYMFSYYDVYKLNMSTEEAMRWLRYAAYNGNREQRSTALYLLGECYQNGTYTAVNNAQALAAYQQSAALDNSRANRTLGEIYKNGMCGENRNYSLAAKYYRRSYQLTNSQEDYWEYQQCNNHR